MTEKFILEEETLDEKKRKKKPYSSKTYTTGDPDLNMKHFNKEFGDGSYMNGTIDPGKYAASANKAAEAAAKSIGTFASQSPDGASSISTGGESSGGEGGGFSGGESLEKLEKDKLNEMMLNKYQHYIEATKRDFPELVKETQDKLDKSENKAEDYAILSVFYSKLMDLAYDKWDDASELFTDDEARMPMPESVGKQFCNMLFNIKNINLLEDLGLWDGLQFAQEFWSTPSEENYADFYNDCIQYYNEMFEEDETEQEELTEAKRYVRRYYIRPQNIFCSNKDEILKALIDIGDENCSVYTLNNLGDDKDVSKLTTKDIIYYYDNGILYDKNRVKIMDYDLAIKHEEKRDNIKPEQVSDKRFNDVYDDRMTQNTVVEKLDPEHELDLDFEDVDIDGEILHEEKEKQVCCICGEEFEGYGNNPEPYHTAENGERCCDACNLHFVIPARIEELK